MYCFFERVHFAGGDIVMGMYYIFAWGDILLFEAIYYICEGVHLAVIDLMILLRLFILFL